MQEAIVSVEYKDIDHECPKCGKVEAIAGNDVQTETGWYFNPDFDIDQSVQNPRRGIIIAYCYDCNTEMFPV